jgi:MHS family proline/betaine transporter-like MFS transporter
MNHGGFTKQQQLTTALLSFGTFLEYFDLMLYVHMAVLLNDLFFPKTDALTAQLFGATAFCLTYVLRPIGGFVIGRIGDAVGRKFTIMLTTFIMATACIIMATIPTYAEIGITASIMVMVSRMLQGFSSLGEIMGAYLYVSETLKSPYRSMAAGMMGVASMVGTLFALVVASFVLSMGMSWRWAFGVGAMIAIIAFWARIRLRETTEFIDYKHKMSEKINTNNSTYHPRQESKIAKSHKVDDEKVNKKTALAYFFTEFHTPFCFCVTYNYISDFMKKSLGMNAEQVIQQNLKVTIFAVIGSLAMVFLAKKIHPIKTAIISSVIFAAFLPFVPYWLNNVSGLFSLFCLQSLIFSLRIPTLGTLDAISYKYFPTGKRFTWIATTFGIANPMGYAIATFGIIPVTYYFGHFGLWILFTPVLIGYCWGLFYFRKLEIEKGLYFNYPHEELVDAKTAAKKL